MRLRYVKDAKDIIESNKDICITEPEAYKGKWRDFKDYNRFEIEVGCGKGQLISSMAERYPNNLYIGIEKFDSVICRAITKVKEKEITNCLLIRHDAALLLDMFDKGEVDKVYLSFPDPWPKARHEKRRLTSPIFMDMYRVILKKGGEIRLKTDNYDLYQYSLESMIPYLDNPKYGIREYTDDELTTEFEDKFRKLGNKIYFIEGKFKEF